MTRSIRGLAVAVLTGLVGVAAADDKPGKPKADPDGTPLELAITGKAKYTLDTGGLTPADYKKKIEDAVKLGGRPPAAPAVDLALEIKNTSDKPVKVWVAGDPVVYDLALTGKGAVTAEPLLAFTQDFRLPQAVEIAPGKTHAIPLKSLTGGFRGASKFSYWTAPGEYELVAKLKTGVTPPPPKAPKDEDGVGTVTLTSAPLKITVAEKK